MKKELETTYDPGAIEERLYQKWLDNKYFHAEVDETKQPYTIVIPPPNITGKLHMGHALDETLQDILIRFKKMQGYNALWIPGTDHASIATEVKIINALKEEGIEKEDLGREKFLERAWDWKEEYGGTIIEQMKKLGSSCDWDRERRIDRKLIRLTAEHTVEDSYRLRTGNRCIRAEIRACRNPALCQSGLHRIVRPVGLGYISERLVRADVGVREARQNRYKLRTGNLSVRLERAVRVAVHQTEPGHLTNSVRIPRGNRNVIKQMVLILDLVHQQRGQQLARLCAGDGRIRTEGAVCVAVHILHMLCGIQLRLRRRILSRARGNRQDCRHECRKHTCGHSLFHHTFILSFRSFSGIVLN